MSVLSIVGARPQFVKAAVVGRALERAGIENMVVHSGQHYDDNMSDVFFRDLDMRAPDYELGVGSGSHARQTGETMMRLEPLCARIRPAAMLVYGDTNTTLAGALVAAKAGVRLAHVEAGLRSFDRSMPEEINRVLTDHVSRWLFCPTETAVRNLAGEGMTQGVHQVGDVMYDAVLWFRRKAGERGSDGGTTPVSPNGAYVLATIHRDFNADDPDRLRAIIGGLSACRYPVVLPAHPRLRKQIGAFRLEGGLAAGGIRMVEPVGYLEMARLEMRAAVLVTDSGGVQKEAFFHGLPCVTVRPNTEWPETVELGWNRLVGADAQEIATAVDAAAAPPVCGELAFPFGDGRAASRLAGILAREL
ncbi:MAG: UDP-N-acetylglucosamine 2-epimerase (non-hydrolyzing) [Lentisphaerae bacterium]|nr:UDP-N-acetylglucosamine 2-epimerase (non-hydrolyzing) [Lentisphaerota bacterium]